MSCDWDIRCCDCGEEAGIPDANHADQEMASLVAHADEIAAIYELSNVLDITLQVNGRHVPFDFFHKHKGHRLRPFNEYGEYTETCNETFVCPRGCGTVACDRREHGDSYSKQHRHSTANRSSHSSE